MLDLPSSATPEIASTENISLDLLDEPPWNVTHSSERSVGLLAENIRQAGFNENLVIASRAEATGRFWVLSGNDKTRAARLAGLSEVPCVVKHGWSEDMMKLQTVRMNALKKPLDGGKFMRLFQELSSKYGAEVVEQAMMFTEQETVKKLLANAKKTLPKELHAELDKKAAKVERIDDVQNVLREIVGRCGSTMDRGYMVMSYGGTEHVYVAMDQELRAKVQALVDRSTLENRHIAELFKERL